MWLYIYSTLRIIHMVQAERNATIFQLQYFPFPFHTAFHGGNQGPSCVEQLACHKIIPKPILSFFASTLPSTVQGPLCAEVMACHNISTPLRTYVVVAFPSALFRTSICFVRVRDTAYAQRGYLLFLHGCVPFRSVPQAHLVPCSCIPLAQSSCRSLGKCIVLRTMCL